MERKYAWKDCSVSAGNIGRAVGMKVGTEHQSHLPLRNKNESLEMESSRRATDIHAFGSLSVFWLVSSVCQSIATSVLDPQEHNTAQLCTKLWVR